MRVGRGDGLDVFALHVLGRDEPEPLFAARDRRRLDRPLEPGLPDHVRHAVAHLQEELDNVRRKGRRVERERAHLGDVRPERPMDSAALDAQHDGEVDRDPLGLDARPAVGAPAVALVRVPHNLEQLIGVLVEAVAVRPDVVGP